jgi:hypothetical protein
MHDAAHRRRVRPTILLALAALALPSGVRAQRFDVSFPASLHAGPITGRMFVFISSDNRREPRFEAGSYAGSVPFFGVDVSGLAPGTPAVIDATTSGFPVASLSDLPTGDYYVQALLDVYTRFPRADGHVIWAHMDHWEGQDLTRSPGNLVSAVQRMHLDPSAGFDVKLSLSEVIPPIEMPPDTKWVKHIKIQSALLTKFWGHPIYLGATVLLPKGYDEHPNASYPVIYDQGHFSLRAPFGFNPDARPMPPRFRDAMRERSARESGYAFTQEWMSDSMPRMIAVTFQHPTPYYDDSYTVNSENDGPYGDAILTELIPYVESHFRIIRQPYARMLTGGSTGGWESLALQVFHPKFFGGTWSLYPDPVDFRNFQLTDLYTDTSAFVPNESGWWVTPRYMMRDVDGQPHTSTSQLSHLEAVLGSHGRSDQQFNAFDAVWGPVGEDGYPRQIWNKHTGHIDRSVVEYMREHGFDLRAYLAKNWSTIGPDLVDKIHVYVGDMDTYYLNLAVYRLQDFFKQTKDPHYEGTFGYGRPMKPHGWQPFTNAELIQMMGKQVRRHGPEADRDHPSWMYK